MGPGHAEGQLVPHPGGPEGAHAAAEGLADGDEGHGDGDEGHGDGDEGLGNGDDGHGDAGGDDDADDPPALRRQNWLLKMNLRYYKTRYYQEKALRKQVEKELAELKAKGKRGKHQRYLTTSGGLSLASDRRWTVSIRYRARTTLYKQRFLVTCFL